jgi:hypothetical protein
MDKASLSEIVKELDSLKSWECSFPFNESDPGEVPKFVDLCQSIHIDECARSLHPNFDKDTFPKRSTMHCFPDHFRGLGGMTSLWKQIESSAFLYGFNVTRDNSRLSAKSRSLRAAEFQVSCKKHVVHVSTK